MRNKLTTLTEIKLELICVVCLFIIECGVCQPKSAKRGALKNCAGTCGNSSYWDSCGVCQTVGKERLDCNGDCYKKHSQRAFINKCGVCVGGKTGRAKTHGIDSCGVCNGKNKTCTDCAGVVHGKKRLDVYGNCLLEKDPTFDATCGAKLVKAFPTVVPVGGGTKVTVLGTGLQTYSKASCSFEGESGEK